MILLFSKWETSEHEIPKVLQWKKHWFIKCNCIAVCATNTIVPSNSVWCWFLQCAMQWIINHKSTAIFRRPCIRLNDATLSYNANSHSSNSTLYSWFDNVGVFSWFKRGHERGVSGFRKHFVMKFDFEFVQTYQDINWCVAMIFHFQISALPKIVLLKACVWTANGHHQSQVQCEFLFRWCN